MSVQVKIPAVGESIASGVVSVWHKKNGEQVSKGEPLFTLETDKVSTEIVAEIDGVLETKAAEGQEVKIGEVVAVIDDSAPAAAGRPVEEKAKSEATPSQPVPSQKESKDSQILSPAVRRIFEEEKLDAATISGSGKGGRITKGDALTAAQKREAKPVPVEPADIIEPEL